MSLREMDEHQLTSRVRLLLGLAAFAVAFDHTLAWLHTNGIDGAAGWVTAACVDVLAAVCLRQLLVSAHASVRWLAAFGLTVSTVLSGLAQVHSNDHGGAGPWLSLIPLGAFAFLQLVHEVERRSASGGRPVEVDRWTGGQVDSTLVLSTPAVHLSTPELSTPAVHPPAMRWVAIGDRPQLPIASSSAPAEKPARPSARRRPAATKAPRTPRRQPAKKAPARPGLSLVVEVPTAVLAQVRAGKLTQKAAAAQVGCSTKSIQRALNPSRSSATGT